MKDSYGEYTDEELIVLLRDGENDITDYIMEKYKGMVKAKAKSMYLLGGDSDDLIQEGMIGLFKAIRDYDSGRDASSAPLRIFAYPDRCIRQCRPLPGRNTCLLTPIFPCTAKTSGRMGMAMRKTA